MKPPFTVEISHRIDLQGDPWELAVTLDGFTIDTLFEAPVSRQRLGYLLRALADAFSKEHYDD